LTESIPERWLFSVEGEGWSTLADDAPERAALRANEAISALVPEGAQGSCRPLAFYPSHRLLRFFKAGDGAELGLFLVSDGENIIHLNGSSPPIHELNKRVSLDLNADDALAYLAFFCFFVRGEEGPFMVVDRLDDPLLPGYLGAPESGEEREKSEVIARLYRPAELFGSDDEGRHRASAMVYYSNVIFVSDFLIGRDGSIDMLDDEPLVEKLPHKIAATIL
jgi:hypothetical protein